MIKIETGASARDYCVRTDKNICSICVLQYSFVFEREHGVVNMDIRKIVNCLWSLVSGLIFDYYATIFIIYLYDLINIILNLYILRCKPKYNLMVKTMCNKVYADIDISQKYFAKCLLTSCIGAFSIGMRHTLHRGRRDS